MDWHAEVELAATLDDNQLDDIAAQVRASYYNSADQVLRLRINLQADAYAAAIDETRVWVASTAEAAVQQHAPDATVLRVVVESDAARTARWAAGTKEAAELLGITPTRVRQLDDTAGFPDRIADPAGGAIYRTDEIETYGRRRVRTKGGRPPKSS